MRRVQSFKRSAAGSRAGAVAVLAVGAVLVTAACGTSGSGGAGTQQSEVEQAQARVTKATSEVTEAEAAFDKASTAFCGSSKEYIAAIDRYGKAFDEKAATVGDVKTAGADLAKPRDEVTSKVQPVLDAHEAVGEAEGELADAEADLAAAKAKAAGSTTASSSTTAPATTTTKPLVPTATADRVKKAEADLTAASQGITDQTPLLQATAQFNAAAFSLEVAWARLFADAGCLEGDQAAQAWTAVMSYTTALQTALTTAGVYSGPIDGLYGPSTVAAVEQLQKANGLTVTGYVDQATGAALDAAVLAKGGAVATQALAHTSAVQSTLKLAGYWTGPIDGQWTPELTEALKRFQTALGVPPTGAVDTATLDALEEAIAKGTSPGPGSPSSPSTSAATTTATTAARSTTTAG